MFRWLWRRRRVAGEAGESLIEVLIAVAIMSVAVVGIAGALVTVVRVSDLHRRQATAGAVVQAFAEALRDHIASGGYVECAEGYAVPYTEPEGFHASVTNVRYYRTSAGQFGPSCPPDDGIQLVTIEVTTQPGGSAVETLDVVVRRP